MKDAFRSALVITLFSFAAQLVLFINQIAIAALFGASPELDAFLAASTLPQYIISVLLGSLGFVFIPLFVDYKAKGGQERAYQLSVSLFNNCILFLGIVSVFGIIFAKPLLLLSTPGIKDQYLETATKVAIITWPTIVASGALSLLTGIYQAERRFNWQAAVPFFGAIANLILLLFLAQVMGVVGLAIATSGGVILQVLLLIRIIAKRDVYTINLNWKDPGVHQIFKLVLPLVMVAVVTKFTPVVERYLASELAEGSISHLNYALRIVTILSVLISSGGATVIFPKMSQDASNNDLNALRNTMSTGLRLMWLIIAPVITIGISLSLPVVLVLFKWGEFTMADAESVAKVLQVYLVGLIAMCLGNVTGKYFYVLKDTKTLAILGSIEAIAYVIYTFFLTQWFGIMGIALGYVLYFNLSLCWQLLILNYKTGNKNGRRIIIAFSKIISSAIVAGIITYLINLFLTGPIVQVIAGGMVGLLVYILILILLNSTELKLFKGLAQQVFPFRQK